MRDGSRWRICHDKWGSLIQPCVVHSIASGKIYFVFFARFTNIKRKSHTFYNKHLKFILLSNGTKHRHLKKNGIVNKKKLFSKAICSCFFIEASWNFICQYALFEFLLYVRTNKWQNFRIIVSRNLETAIDCSVPHGSILGPREYCIYTLPLRTLIHVLALMFHFFADDSSYKLWIRVNPRSYCEQISSVKHRIQYILCGYVDVSQQAPA